MSTTPFTPITKEQAAQILAVSVRTIDHHVRDGRMPPPVHLGRRAYWRPDVFYAWLHQALGAPCAGVVAREENAHGPRAQPEQVATRSPSPGPAAMVLPKPRKSQQSSAGRSPLAARVTQRDTAVLAALNATD